MLTLGIFAAYKMFIEAKYKFKTKKNLKRVNNLVEDITSTVAETNYMGFDDYKKMKNLRKELILLNNHLNFFQHVQGYKKEYKDLSSLEKMLVIAKTNLDNHSISDLLEGSIKVYLNRDKSINFWDEMKKVNLEDNELERILKETILTERRNKYILDYESLVSQISEKITNLDLVYSPKDEKLLLNPKMSKNLSKSKATIKVKKRLREKVRFSVQYIPNVELKHLSERESSTYVVSYILTNEAKPSIRNKVTNTKYANKSIILISNGIFYNKDDEVSRLYSSLAVNNSSEFNLEYIADNVSKIDRDSYLEALSKFNLSERLDFVDPKHFLKGGEKNGRTS